MAAPCAPLDFVRGPLRNHSGGRPFNGIVRSHNESLQRGEYYANPRNSFWRIIDALLHIPAKMEYAGRVRLLSAHGVALWNVCAAAPWANNQR